MSSIAFWWNSLGFYIQDPKYVCTFTEPVSDPDDVCTAKNICNDDKRIDTWDIDWDDSNSLHNWIERLDMMCMPDWQVGLLGSAFWIGFITTMLWIPRISDVRGRMQLFRVGCVVSAALYIVLVFSKNYYLTITAIFFFGVTNTIRTIIGFVYMTELMPKSSQKVAVTIFWIIDGCIYLCVVIYFWQISDECMPLISFGCCFMVIAALLCWFLPESPVYLI